MAEPLVGRAEQTALLADLERRVEAQGRPGAVLVLGPPGLGKSRLLAEARARTRARALTMVGYEPEREVPLAAASDLLRDLAAVPGPGRSLAALLAGELGAGGALESVRIFEAAHQARRALGLTLLTVDDLQWVDALSLALCHYLVRAAAAAQEPLAFVAASRPSPFAGGFAAALDERLAGSLGLTTLQLPPLEPDSALLLAQAVEPGITTERAEEIVRLAAGSPFWIRALAQGGTEVDASRAVRSRLGAASGDARALVAALAVAGRPLSTGDIGELMEWPGERAARAVAEVVARGLAVEEDGAVALAHDLIREGALGGLADDARRRLHLRLAARIEQDAGEDLTLLRAALAHRQAGGGTSLELASRIARSPRRRLLGEEGVAELAAIAEEGADQGAALDLQASVAELAREIGDHERALALWSRIAEGAADPALRLRAWLAAGWAAFVLGRAAEARSLLAGARAAGPAGPRAVETDALEASILIWLDNRVAEGGSLAARALDAGRAMAAAAGGVEGLSDTGRRAYLHALGAAFDRALRLDETEAIVVIADEMVEATRGFDEEAHLESLRHGAVAALEAGRLPEAEARLRRVCDEARRRIFPAAEVRAAGYLARTLLIMGRLDDAAAAAERVRGIGDHADLPGWRHLPRIRCEIDLLRANPELACRRLAALAAAETNPHARLHAQRKLLEALARLGGRQREEEVVRLVGEAGESARAADCANCAADLDIEAAEALARIGREDEARRSPALRGAPRAGEHSVLRRRWIEALLTPSAQGERAASGLVAVVADATRLERRPDALWAGIDLGRTLGPLDRAGAEEALRAVVAGAEAIGSTTHAALARRELRRLGVRAWRRGAAAGPGEPPDQLSPRELEIALLAAAGSSNPEIARTVFLSRKTVERHVSNALAKLGARNRTELAARLPQLEALREAGRRVEGPPP